MFGVLLGARGPSTRDVIPLTEYRHDIGRRVSGDARYGAAMPSTYPPLNLAVRTPRLTLAAATDDLLERLVPVVRAGLVNEDEPPPFDDPMTFYLDSPDREQAWMRRVWAGRSRIDESFWRIELAGVAECKPVLGL
jgi:hypothetical protein